MAARRDRLQEVRATSASPSTPTAACSCRSSATSTEEHHRAGGRARAGCPRRRARGKLSLDEMQGGCFTITNLGGIGGTSLHADRQLARRSRSSASRAARMRAGVDRTSAFEPRLMLPLSLSYDHRVIDGADGDPLPALGRRGARAAVRAGAQVSGRRRRDQAPISRGSTSTIRASAAYVVTTQLVVIGAGPGGYAAAFYAADLGLQVTLVDAEIESRRRLPLSRLHPVEGAAARRQGDRRGAARRARGASTFGEPTIDLDKLRAFKDKRRRRS